MVHPAKRGTLLVLVAGLTFGAIIAPAAAQGLFLNGENASLVLGQRDLTSNVAAVTRRGENGPGAVALDNAGDMWVSDQCNSRLLEYKPPFENHMAASVVLGEPNFITTSSPQPCFSGTIQPTNAANILSYNDGFGLDASGDIWVADSGNNRVLEFVPPFTNGMSPSRVIGQPNFTSSATATTANGMSFPTDLTFDAVGDLWVVDAENNRVLEFVPPFTDGMKASLVVGQANFASSDCVTTRRGFCEPNNIVFDAGGNLWILDAFVNNRLLQFQAPFRTGMRASREIGQPNFTSNSPGLGRSEFNLTDGSGMGIDGDGNIWVADLDNNRMLEFPYVNGAIEKHAAIVIGQPNFESSASATSPGGLSFPVTPAFDMSGNLWAPDSNNNRVLEYKAHP